MVGLVGRNSERDVVATFLAAAASAPALLTIDGEAGIGKTTLCGYCIERAREARSAVLSCRPALAESSLSFAALTDLLAGLSDHELERLPAPQRHALAVATLREEPAGAPPEQRAIGTALKTLLTQLAANGPLVIVIDDTQWVDRATAEVLGFALRRTAVAPIGLLTSRRTGSDAQAGLTEVILDPPWQSALKLGPLSPAALFHVIRGQLGITLPHPALVRISEASRGNPYVALELARVGTDTTAVPDALHSLSVDRLARLTPKAQEALLAAACTPRPTLARLDALGLRGHLDEAEAVGIVRLIDGRVEFSHPLLSTAAIEVATGPATRSMHQRLAEQSDDPEEVAHHRALATQGPDEGVAAALDAATESAALRGAGVSAVELSRLALARTEDPAGAQAWTRRVRAAELVYTSGDTLEATALLADLEASCPPGPLRGRGWLLLTQVAYQTSSQRRAQECASYALADAGEDVKLRANALLSLSALATSNTDRVRYSVEARRCIEEGASDDPGLLAWALCEEITATFHAGDGLDLEALNRALAIERTGRSWSSDDQVAAVRPVLLKWADLYLDALAALAELEARAAEEGNEGILPYTLGHRSSTLLRMGRFDDAAAAAADHLFQADATGQSGQRIQALCNLAAADAHAGRLDQAVARAHEVLAWSDHEQDPWQEMCATGILGFVSLSANDVAEACRWFERWARAADADGVVDPGISRHHGDRIEALVALGATDEATELTAQLTAAAARAGRVSVAAVAARCRGMLAAAAGDHHAATHHLDGARLLHAQVGVPFDTARTLFVEGVVHRRAKEKRLARDALVESERVFQQLGAEAWAARAGAELGRIGSRPAASLDLTGTERRVAELVASGLTNRQVAQQAFMSSKTVEANLSKVYRKLGISSRAQLGAHMARIEGAD